MKDLVSGKQIDISFCLPVFNVENYLDDCINSIVSQCKSDFSYEILCVDDSSTDNSYEILKSLQNKVGQLNLHKNEINRGVSYTRNRLISLAKGKYIWFVDPDDMLFPGTVRKLYNEIEKNNENVILGDYIYCNENAKYEDFNEINEENPFEIITIGNGVSLPRSETGKLMNSVCMGMFKKEFLIKNNLSFNEKMTAQEDTLFYYDFTLKTDKIIKYTLPCYIYRHRKSSVMNSRNSERTKRYYNSIRVMYDVYNSNLLNGNYRDKEDLLTKLHHMRHNIIITLAAVPDTKYVRKQLKELKQKKLYPYPFRTETLKTDENILRRIILFLQPIEVFFWMLHTVYKIKSKIINKI